MSDENNFESNGQNFFVKAAFFCFHFYLCVVGVISVV